MAKIKGQKEINNIQNTTQTTIDREVRTPQQTGVNSGFSGRMSSSCSTSDTHRFANSMIHEEDRRTVL
jgi:hypothetical protein